jgi:hypothetical protein
MGASLKRVLLRAWFVAAVLWLLWCAYFFRDRLSGFWSRDWDRALAWGLNNIFCDIRILGNCRDLGVAITEQAELNETFLMLVFFAGVPLLGLLAVLVVAWIFGVRRESAA